MNPSYTPDIGREILNRLGYTSLPNKTRFNLSCKEHKDNHPSFSVDIERNMCHCFSCGIGGSLTKLYYNTFHKSIYTELGIQTDPNYQSQEIKFSYGDVPESDFEYNGKKYPVDITEAGKKWLKYRGFSKQDLTNVKACYSQFGIFKRGSDPTNKSEWIYVFNRFMIPIYESGILISYELRDIMGETHYKKQLAKKGLGIDKHPYKKLLYPKNSSVNTLFELSKLKKDETLYIVEGLMDLISLRTCNLFKNSTCLFHCIPTERQLFLLKDFKDICYITDNDLPSFMGCKKLMERHSQASFLSVPNSNGKVKDVNDILQKKDPRFNTINDLVNFGWLKNIRRSMSDLEQNIKKFTS